MYSIKTKIRVSVNGLVYEDTLFNARMSPLKRARTIEAILREVRVVTEGDTRSTRALRRIGRCRWYWFHLVKAIRKHTNLGLKEAVDIADTVLNEVQAIPVQPSGVD